MAFEHFDGWLYAEPFLAVVPCLLRSFLLPPPHGKQFLRLRPGHCSLCRDAVSDVVIFPAYAGIIPHR